MIQLRFSTLNIDLKLWNTESDSVTSTQKELKNTGMSLSRQKGEKIEESATRRLQCYQQSPRLKKTFLEKIKNLKKKKENLRKRERNRTVMLRTELTNSKVFLRGLLNVRGKQILATKCYWNPKRKLGVTKHFSKIINQQYLQKNKNKKIKKKSFKIQSNVWRSFPNSSLIIPDKCMVTPNFLFRYQEHLLTSALSCIIFNCTQISLY